MGFRVAFWDLSENESIATMSFLIQKYQELSKYL